MAAPSYGQGRGSEGLIKVCVVPPEVPAPPPTSMNRTYPWVRFLQEYLRVPQKATSPAELYLQAELYIGMSNVGA